MATDTVLKGRRNPTDRRSWEQTPVFVGDTAAHVDDIAPLVVVTGVLPGDRVEIVRLEQVWTSPGTYRTLGDVQEAVGDGRLVTYAARRDDLSPATHRMLEHYREGCR